MSWFIFIKGDCSGSQIWSLAVCLSLLTCSRTGNTPKQAHIICGSFLMTHDRLDSKLNFPLLSGQNCSKHWDKTVWESNKSRVFAPVVTSLMSSAALWQPSTSRWVQVDSSLAESTLNTWVSTPCFVPERRPNERSESRRGELFPGPEWTSLKGRKEERGWQRGYIKSASRAKKWVRVVCTLQNWKLDVENWGKDEGRKNTWLIDSDSTNVFRMNVTLCVKMS